LLGKSARKYHIRCIFLLTRHNETNIPFVIVTRQTSKKTRKSNTFMGRVSQTAAAKKLNVSREHLNRVLRGHRESRSLLRRFRELQEEAAR